MTEQLQVEVDPMAEAEAKDADAFESTYRQLKEFVAEHAEMFGKLRKLVDKYTEARKAVEERLRTRSKNTGQEMIMGLLRSKVIPLMKTNFDALEEIVTEEEFRDVCEITYSFRGDKGVLGKAALAKLRQKYGAKLDGLEQPATPRVEIKGPKDIDIKELGVLL